MYIHLIVSIIILRTNNITKYRTNELQQRYIILKMWCNFFVSYLFAILTNALSNVVTA